MSYSNPFTQVISKRGLDKECVGEMGLAYLILAILENLAPEETTNANAARDVLDYVKGVVGDATHLSGAVRTLRGCLDDGTV